MQSSLRCQNCIFCVITPGYVLWPEIRDNAFFPAEISHHYNCSGIIFPLKSDCLEPFCSRLVINVIGREMYIPL